MEDDRDVSCAFVLCPVWGSELFLDGDISKTTTEQLLTTYDATDKVGIQVEPEYLFCEFDRRSSRAVKCAIRYTYQRRRLIGLGCDWIIMCRGEDGGFGLNILYVII